MFSIAVAFVFRLINFFALIYLAIYLFKKYLLNALEDAVSEQEAFKDGLKQQQGMFESRLDESKQERDDIERLGQLLKNKVDRWQESVRIKEKNMQAKKGQIHELSVRRANQQTMHLAMQTVTRLAMVKAIPQAQEKLQEYYKDAASAERYIVSTLGLLKRDTR